MRTKAKQIKRECEQIKSLWAQGWDDEQVRTYIGLSKQQFETRLKYIARDKYSDKNRELTLLKYEMKKQRRYDQLEAILRSSNDNDMKLKCIQEMSKIDETFIEMGQRLGVFPEAPKKITGAIATHNVNENYQQIQVDESVTKKYDIETRNRVAMATGAAIKKELARMSKKKS